MGHGLTEHWIEHVLQRHVADEIHVLFAQGTVTVDEGDQYAFTRLEVFQLGTILVGHVDVLIVERISQMVAITMAEEEVVLVFPLQISCTFFCTFVVEGYEQLVFTDQKSRDDQEFGFPFPYRW